MNQTKFPFLPTYVQLMLIIGNIFVQHRLEVIFARESIRTFMGTLEEIEIHFYYYSFVYIVISFYGMKISAR